MNQSRSAVACLPLVRFLIDRIDDDEQALDRLARLESRGEPPSRPVVGVGSTEQLRANLIAKRHIIGDLQHLVILRDLPVEAPIRAHALSALCAMAVVYRHHAGFRREWAEWMVTATSERGASVARQSA